MTEYTIEELNKFMEFYSDSDPLTLEGALEGLQDATPREVVEEMLVLQDIFTAMVHRIRDLEAELEKYVNRKTVR